MAVTSSDGLSEIQLDEVTSQRSSDFEVWTDLISNVEQMYHDDINKISLVYDSFLSEFPLCYGYWKKYAEHKARLCGVENAVQIFEQAVELAPYSVDVWLEYCNFGVSFFEDPSDVCRLFDKGLLFVGKDYLCYKIWDKYIEFEFSQQHWNSLANIYIQTLKFPTKKLHQYYESFRKLVAIWEEEMRCQGISCTKVLSEYEINDDIKTLEDTEISHVINDLLDSSTRSKALSKYRSIGEQFYQRACDLDGKVQKFERNIRRPYFHVKPLDDNQLQNWHQYLDLIEAEGDFDWAMKLYERCLISCANYPEFWMRYVDYIESKGAREIATDALERATLIFLKNGPQIHLFNAWFKEELGDVDGLRAAFEHCDQHYESYPIEYVRRKANMERRLGNYIAACNIYKEALDMAAEKRPDTLPMLYLYFARLQLMITNNVDAAREVLLNGIQCVPRSKVLLKELILFAFMHEGAIQVDTLDSIMTKALTPGSDISSSLNAKECEDISSLYLELIDFCGSIHDVRRAWNRHLKLFPHVMRVDYSLKKPSKAYTVWKMINDGKPDHFDCCDQHSLGKHAENHLKEKVLEGQNIDQSEQDIDDQAQVGGSNNCSLNNMEMVASEATKTHPRDTCGENESSDQAAADNSLLKVDSKTDGFHKEQDQQKELKNQLKPPSSDNPSLNPQDDESQNIAASPAPGFEPPPEASLSNRSTPAYGRDIDDVPRIFGPVSPRDTNATGRDNGSPGPSFRQSHKNHSLEASPHRNSDREGNWGRLNPSGKGRPNVSSCNSEERRERSLSPRRRSHGYLDDRRHRERSLSPRRHRERSLSPRRHRERSLSPRRHNNSRWQRERRNHRNFRYHDNSRGRRDGRIQNENQAVVVGNTGQTPNFQPQSMGFVSQLQRNAQPVAYSQGQMKQGPVPSNENVGNLQNNQLYNQMWQYYYYNQQQQQLLQQQPPYQQQQMQPHQQLQQQMQNPSQQHMQASQQQPQPINAQQQQLLNLQYQQHLLSQQPQFQQQQQQQPPPTTEQPHSQEQQLQLQQQMQLPQQQLYQQLQQQQVQIQQQPQDEVDAQKQQQQAYQYQQLQQQQYLLYLQQLQQYQYSQQQPGLVKDQPSVQQQQHLPAKQEGQENLRELPLGDEKLQPEPQHGDGSLLVDPRSSSHCQQGPEVEGSHTSISSGVASLPPPQDQLPELEETDM